MRRHQRRFCRQSDVSVFRRALVRSLTVVFGGVASHAHARSKMGNASVHENDLGSLRTQTLREYSVGHFGNRFSTSEEVDGGVPVFRPSVNREMTLFDHHDTGHSLRLKWLKDRCDDVRTGCFSGLIHQRFNSFEVIQYRRVAARVLNE
jgi:hypothetical protein